jgi:hypothetical protein
MNDNNDSHDMNDSNDMNDSSNMNDNNDSHDMNDSNDINDSSITWPLTNNSTNDKTIITLIIFCIDMIK